jgi:anti-sigma-K factor RskA
MKADLTHDEHREMADLVPWYVNGTLGAPERQRVDAHVLACKACRDDLQLERRLFEGMAAEPPVEYMPAASLKRLQAALDARGAAAPAPEKSVRIRPTRGSILWKGLAAASIVVAAVIAAFLAADRWPPFRDRGPPIYRTVTSPRPHAPDEVIRAVFSPGLTLLDLQAILGESQLRIVSGPTEAGVYSLAATSSRPVSVSLGLLRRHSEVRFAESTRVDDTDPRSREPP